MRVTLGDTAGQRRSWDVSKVVRVYYSWGKAGGWGRQALSHR